MYLCVSFACICKIHTFDPWVSYSTHLLPRCLLLAVIVAGVVVVVANESLNAQPAELDSCVVAVVVMYLGCRLIILHNSHTRKSRR